MKKEAEPKIKDSSEVGITLDSYEDIFSDFDPRPYSAKGLSEDFLFEARRAAISKYPNKISLIMMLPKAKRNSKQEVVIKKRLKDYFRERYNFSMKEKRRVVKEGIIFTVIGIILMVAVSYVYFIFNKETVLASFLTILLEPASWFLFWEGLDLLIFDSKKEKPDLEFYREMAGADISFVSS